jgi:uncharacterized protein YbdZ (MbtH family)
MNRFPARYFKVVTHPEGDHAVWFADAPRQAPWQDTGHEGSEDECWDYLEAAEISEGFMLYFGWGSR